MKTYSDFESYTAEDLLQYCLDYTFWLTQVATWISDHTDNPSFEPLQYLNDRIKEKAYDLRFIAEYNDWYRAYVEDELQEKVDNCKYDL